MGRRTERERERRPKEGALCAVRRAAPLPPHLCLLPPPCEKSAEAARKKSAHGRFFLKHVCVCAAKRVKAGGICFIVLFAALGIGFCKLCHGTVALRN